MNETKILTGTPYKIRNNLQLKLENCEREERKKDTKSESNGEEKSTSFPFLSHNSMNYEESTLEESGFLGSFDAPWSERSWIDLFSKETQNPLVCLVLFLVFTINWTLISTGINLREACEKQAASINNATHKRATTTEHGSSEDATEPTLSVTQRIPMKQVLSLQTEQVNTPVLTIFSEKFLSYIMRLWIFLYHDFAEREAG